MDAVGGSGEGKGEEQATEKERVASREAGSRQTLKRTGTESAYCCGEIFLISGFG